MITIQKDQRLYLKSEAFCNTKLVSHGFTGSQGGVSHGNICGLNLGFRVGDNPDSVMENYRLVAEDLSMPMSNMVLSRQTHTDHIRIVTEEDAGKGITKESDIYDTDGLMTNLCGIPLVIFTADCVPLLFLDPVKKTIAAVHAGWRGTVKGIGSKAVLMMQEHYGSNPKDILVAIGPSIGPCCFSFDKKDACVFPKAYVTPQADDKVLVDIWAMNRDLLLAQGVLKEHIDQSNLCTVCHADDYYSYRTHKDRTGRQCGVIMLKS